MTEDDLFAAHRNGSVYQTRCACGLVIESPTGREADVMRAIDIHNQSTVHQRWSQWQQSLLESRREVA